MPLKSIINAFKIDLKSIPMDSHRWKIDSHRWDYRLEIDGDPWDLNRGNDSTFHSKISHDLQFSSDQERKGIEKGTKILLFYLSTF